MPTASVAVGNRHNQQISVIIQPFRASLQSISITNASSCTPVHNHCDKSSTTVAHHQHDNHSHASSTNHTGQFPSLSNPIVFSLWSFFTCTPLMLLIMASSHQPHPSWHWGNQTTEFNPQKGGISEYTTTHHRSLRPLCYVVFASIVINHVAQGPILLCTYTYMPATHHLRHLFFILWCHLGWHILSVFLGLSMLLCRCILTLIIQGTHTIHDH